jgi:hypothetical protein
LSGDHVLRQVVGPCSRRCRPEFHEALGFPIESDQLTDQSPQGLGVEALEVGVDPTLRWRRSRGGYLRVDDRQTQSDQVLAEEALVEMRARARGGQVRVGPIELDLVDVLCLDRSLRMPAAHTETVDIADVVLTTGKHRLAGVAQQIGLRQLLGGCSTAHRTILGHRRATADGDVRVWQRVVDVQST